MNHYSRLICLSLVIYIICAVLSGLLIWSMEHENTQIYRVESNRILHQLTNVEQFYQLKLDEDQAIKNVTFLSVDNREEQVIMEFYSEENGTPHLISPWYLEGQLAGYLKFSYRTENCHRMQYFLVMEGCMLLLESCLLCLLYYLKRNVMKPFDTLAQLPYQLAKGHYQGDVKVEKSKYFAHFLWGMSQLKDRLAHSEKHQLELLKEKKQLLLSLSHDIKTPLNTIDLYAKALEEEVYTERISQRQAYHQIGCKVKEIEHYVDEIIKSFREDIMTLPCKQGEFYITDLMERLLLVYKAKCQLRHLDLVVHSYENRLLHGDVERAQEVLENLFENAFKYGDGKRIEITFYEEDYCQLIKIFNTGNVVNDHECNHLFDSFFRASNSDGLAGNGLGLYICRELMRKMDGAIFIEKANDGMAFVLVFR